MKKTKTRKEREGEKYFLELGITVKCRDGTHRGHRRAVLT